MALMGASGSCLPFKKQFDATTPAMQLGGFSTVSQCPSFLGVNAPAPGYQGEVDPVFQRICATCHVSGTGSAKFKMTAGDSQDNDVAAANFFVARDEAVPIGGGVDPDNPDATSPLLERLNGTITHDLRLISAAVITRRSATGLHRSCSTLA